MISCIKSYAVLVTKVAVLVYPSVPPSTTSTIIATYRQAKCQIASLNTSLVKLWVMLGYAKATLI